MSTPKLIDRIRNTYKFFRYGNTYPAVNVKRSPYMFPFGVSGQPQWAMVDYNSYYADGFSANAVIYACIMVKVRAIAQTNLVAATGSLDNPDLIDDDNHPLYILLDRPNPYQSGSEFNQLQSVYLNLTGNAFTYLNRDRSSRLATEMWALNPTDVQIIPNNKGGIMGYRYNPSGRLGDDSVSILPENMMHVKLPNPLDPLNGLGFGMSPISPLAKSGDVDNNITDFMKMFFQHGAMPTGALKLKDLMLDDDSVNEIKEKWMEVYGGFNNWSDIAVLDMTMEYERIGMTFQDMDFTELDQRNESRMLLPFGVPAELMPIKLGLQGNTFANKTEARKWFWEDTMMYEMDLFLDTYAAYLSTDDGAFPYWDISKVSALKKDIAGLVTAAKELWSMGVPASEAFNTVGLTVAEYEGIDTGYLPFNVVPVGGNPFSNNSSTTDNTNNTQTTTTDSSSDTQDNAQNEQSTDNANKSRVKKKTNKGFTPEQKTIIYKAVDRIALQHEDAFRSAAEKSLTYDKRKILSIVNRHKTKSLEIKASVNFPAIETDIETYLFSESGDNWRNQFTPVMQAEVEDTGKFWSGQLGVQFDIRNIEGESWFTDYTTVFANPITDTSNEVIHGIVQQAMAEGWSIDEMSNTLSDTFDYWLEGDLSKVDFDFLTRPAANPRLGNRLLHWRKELIARTETTRLNNAGARNLFSRWGVGKKEWLSTGDDRTRDSHIVMSGQVVGIGEKFKSGLGNELDYPGDPSAPLADTAQCRCTILPVIDKDVQPEESLQELVFDDYNVNSSGLSDFENEWKTKMGNLSDEQIKAFKDYTGGDYLYINQDLRGIKSLEENGRLTSAQKTKLKNDIELMKSGMKDTLSKDTILRREASTDFYSYLGYGDVNSDLGNLIGTTFTDNGFVSTAVKTPDYFSESLIQMEIEAKAGQTGAYLESITKAAGENEFLLPPGTQFRIKNVIEIQKRGQGGPGITKFIMEII